MNQFMSNTTTFLDDTKEAIAPLLSSIDCRGETDDYRVGFTRLHPQPEKRSK